MAENVIENLVNTLISAVTESGNGFPEGHLYMALVEKLNFSLENFRRVKLLMLATGRVKSQGNLLIAV